MLHRIAFPVVSEWCQQRHNSCTILLTRARIRSTPSTSLTQQHTAHSRPLLPLNALEGRDTADGMDEALGLATYSRTWLPSRGRSGSHSYSKAWAGCRVSPTAPVKRLLNASRSVAWRSMTERASRIYDAASSFLNLLPKGDNGM